MRRLAKLQLLAALTGVVLVAPLTPALAGTASGVTASGSTPPPATGAAWPLPKSPASPGNLAPLGGAAGGTAAQQAAIAFAGRQARATGKPVVAGALTTATTSVTAEPDGLLSLVSNLLPVRVRDGSGWTQVRTALRHGPGGSWSAAAVPGDAVAFSGGGDGPLVTLTAAGTGLSLSWPGRLPAPVISGSSATYHNVLPGVDLVATATAAQAGGFSEVLVVHDAGAARNPALARLSLRVSGRGVRLASTAGGLAARAANGRGSYVASAPVMWDSGSAAPGSAATTAAGRSARSVGATLAPPGSGTSSSVAGPATGSRVASLAAAVTGGGTSLSLVPDAKMLASAATRFPLYIHPAAFNWHSEDGDQQHFDIFQSGCPTAHNYDTTDTTDYGTLPVGYDGWEGCNPGTGFVYSYDFSYYQIQVPSVLWGANIDTATFNAEEFYASACVDADVTLSLTGAFGKNSDWNNKPGVSSYQDTKNTVPVSGDCGTSNNGVGTGVGFNVLGAVSDAAAHRWSSATFRLWEDGDCPSACDGGNGDGNKNDLRRFGRSTTTAPYIQVLYADTPEVPGHLKATATSDGTGSVGCDTSATDSNMPAMGKTASVHGPYLWATYNDADTDTVSSTVQYWNAASPATTYTATAGSSLSTGSTPVAAEIPASFTSGMANGTVVGWRADATDGPFTSNWSSKCYFKVYPTDPDPPALSAVSGTPTVGSQVSVTITSDNDNTDPPSKFVWGLDQVPPTAGSIPAAQECTTTAATSACSEISGGSATLTITVPSPGAHDLWVYELDTAGNESGITNGAPEADTVTFTAASDQEVDYTSDASLSANFTDALDAGKSYDNEMISDGATTCGSGANGSGDAFPSAQLQTAGWNPSGAVTVDGAQFTLPDFGSCGPDNLLAANQTLGAGNAQASALVFLATSTSAFAQVPGTVSGAPDSGVMTGDPTAPAVPGGTPVTGSGCTAVFAFDTSQEGCTPASGTIYYAGSACAATPSVPYQLTVPDWVSGPSDIAAVSVPDWASASGLQAESPKIYAFAVPLDAACQVTKVSLPDVGASVSYTVASGVTYPVPGLHILAMALRNTTTATPGSTVAQPPGQAWTGAFASPVDDAWKPSSGSWGNQTIRLAVSPSVSAPAGADIRIRLSDPGFLSADGTGQLMIDGASIAEDYYQAIPAQAPAALTFGGKASVTIPEGGDAYSDPLTLPFAVKAGTMLLVSLWLENSVPVLPGNSWTSGAFEWFAPPGSGDNTADQTGTPFTETGSSLSGSTSILTGVDVTTPAGAASPGDPTVVVAGDNVTDGFSADAFSDALNAPSQRLAGQLASQGLAGGFGVVDAGIEANQVLSDSSTGGGVSLLARFDRDILAEPDVGTVIINEGLEDLLQAGAGTVQYSGTLVAGSLEAGYAELINQLNAAGINVIVATLTPCSGYVNATGGDSCTSGSGDSALACQTQSSSTSTSVDNDRDTVDYDVCNGGLSATPAPCPVDFDGAVTNGASPEALAAADDTGDHVNLTPAGYAALAPAVTSGACSLAASSNPLAAPS